jgi:hypothetical protein
MFLRCHLRKKDGKQHRDYSVEESRRLLSGRVVQRRVLYLGEINDCQQAAWRKTLEVFDERQQRATTLRLFPEDRPAPAGALDTIQVKLSEMQLRRARPYGNCWLGCELWRQLELDRFWERTLPRGREEVSWPQVHILVCFLAYVLWKTMGRLCHQAGLGDEARKVFAELQKISLVDVVLPTRTGIAIRKRCVSRPTEHQAILLQRLGLELPTSIEIANL